MKSKDDIFIELAQMMHSMFRIPIEDIKYESRFYDDLGLDSIDAIDLITQFQTVIGERINPDEFKAVRTVGDVVNAADKIMSQGKGRNMAQSL